MAIGAAYVTINSGKGILGAFRTDALRVTGDGAAHLETGRTFGRVFGRESAELPLKVSWYDGQAGELLNGLQSLKAHTPEAAPASGPAGATRVGEPTLADFRVDEAWRTEILPGWLTVTTPDGPSYAMKMAEATRLARSAPPADPGLAQLLDVFATGRDAAASIRRDGHREGSDHIFSWGG